METALFVLHRNASQL